MKWNICQTTTFDCVFLHPCYCVLYTDEMSHIIYCHVASFIIYPFQMTAILSAARFQYCSYCTPCSE